MNAIILSANYFTNDEGYIKVALNLDKEIEGFVNTANGREKSAVKTVYVNPNKITEANFDIDIAVCNLKGEKHYDTLVKLIHHATLVFERELHYAGEKLESSDKPLDKDIFITKISDIHIHPRIYKWGEKQGLL